MKEANVYEIKFLSGLTLVKRNGRFYYDNPSWVRSGKTWAGLIGFDTLQEALDVADEISEAAERAFKAHQAANRAEQEFYRVAMKVTPASSRTLTNYSEESNKSVVELEA